MNLRLTPCPLLGGFFELKLYEVNDVHEAIRKSSLVMA